MTYLVLLLCLMLWRCYPSNTDNADARELMVRIDVTGQEGFSDVSLSLTTDDDALTYTRSACNLAGLHARDCSDLLEVVVGMMKSFVENEGEENPYVQQLVSGHNTNSILIRNDGMDELSMEVQETFNVSANYQHSEDELKPLNIFFHLDKTNNLGDKWTAYLFLHYAHKLGYQRRIKFATNKTDALVTSVGSTLQWLFKEENDRIDIFDEKHPNSHILDHDRSGLRTSIGNGFISPEVEEWLYDDPLIDIVGVRGPLTQSVLSRTLNRVPPVISDPGLLAPRLYPLHRPPAARRRPVGFVVHEGHREAFVKVFPQFQSNLVDNHVTLNARAFLEQLLSYEVIISSSLHGIVFSHAYGVPVLPVAFHVEEDLHSDIGEKVVGGDFKYKDYYSSIGYGGFARRVPLLDSTFDSATTSSEEIVQRLTVMARMHWQPDRGVIKGLQDTQEALIIDYLELYQSDHDIALMSSGSGGNRGCGGVEVEEREKKGTGVNLIPRAGDDQDEGEGQGEGEGEGEREKKGKGFRLPPSLIQDYLLLHALAELYPPSSSVPCGGPHHCLNNMNISVPYTQVQLHQSARNAVNGLILKLVFPRRLIKRVRGLADTFGKSNGLEFNFLGLVTPQRDWVFAFDAYSELTTEQKQAAEGVEDHAYKRTSLVRPSLKGRNPRKYLFDYEYFNVLATSKFTLCPVGDYQWSYRFLEAIMALSIPVLSTLDPMDKTTFPVALIALFDLS